MSSADWAQLLPLVLIAVVFWLLILRPARRRQQETARLQRSLTVGDRVLLSSGLFGTIHSVEDETLQLEVAPGVLLTVHRQAVAKVVEPGHREQVVTGDDAAGDEAAGRAEESADDDSARRSDHGGDARP